MKISKIFLTVFTVMLILAGTSIASAGDGTAGDPYTVLYVGYNMPGSYTDMVNGPIALSAVASNVTARDPVYYTTDYVAIIYDISYEPTPASLDDAADAVSSGTYDYVITDMAFTGYSYDNGGPIDTARANFSAACAAINNTITDTASIYSDDGTNSYAPTNFNFRDKLVYSTTNPKVPFTARMNAGLIAMSGGDPNFYPSSVADYEVILSYLN